MYAHVNLWRLSEAGRSDDDQAAGEIATLLGGQPGFRSYTLVRTGEREVAVITVFDSQAELEQAIDAIGQQVHQRLGALVENPPERRAGEVVYQLTV